MTMGNHLSASRTGKTNRGDRFMAVRQGEIVLDTKTKLMWAAKDNGSDTSWKNALNYCDHYRGGGYTDWRMPTLDELAGLYDAEKTQPNETIPSMPLHLSESINLSSCCIWAAEARGTGAAYFNFNTGLRNWTPHARDTAGRALPVRSGK